VTLLNGTGLHVRPATLFVETASRFRAEIDVLTGDRTADGKSALSLMLLEAGRGTELTIQGSGEDETAAVEALVDLVERRFGESDA
jgi:phosphocarrier protein HPr